MRCCRRLVAPLGLVSLLLRLGGLRCLLRYYRGLEILLKLVLARQDTIQLGYPGGASLTFPGFQTG